MKILILTISLFSLPNFWPRASLLRKYETVNRIAQLKVNCFNPDQKFYETVKHDEWLVV